MSTIIGSNAAVDREGVTTVTFLVFQGCTNDLSPDRPCVDTSSRRTRSDDGLVARRAG